MSNKNFLKSEIQKTDYIMIFFLHYHKNDKCLLDGKSKLVIPSRISIKSCIIKNWIYFTKKRKKLLEKQIFEEINVNNFIDVIQKKYNCIIDVENFYKNISIELINFYEDKFIYFKEN